MPAETIPCPRCSAGQVVLKKSKENKAFYGCSRFPACRFNSTRKPIAGRCPVCSSSYLVEVTVRKVLWARCPHKECDFERRLSIFFEHLPPN